MTTQKESRAKPINKNWAAMDAAGLSFTIIKSDVLQMACLSSKPPPHRPTGTPPCDCSVECDCIVCILDEFFLFHDYCSQSYATKLTLSEEMTALKHARKGSNRDIAMYNAIANYPDVQAAISSAIEAATITKHIRPPTTSHRATRL